MRIAYVAEWDVSSPSGVLTKMISQFSAWRAAGHDARLFILDDTPAEAVTGAARGCPGLEVLSFSSPAGVPSKIGKALAMPRLRRAIGSFAPEIIYYRHSSWTPGLMGVLRSAPSWVVEVNSLEDIEIGLKGPVARLYHKLTGTLVLQRASALVCVAHQLAEALAGFGKRTAVIANGYTIDASSHRPAPRNIRPQLLFAGSPGQPWQGVDKVVELASLLPDYDFHVFGEMARSDLPNLTYYGVVDRDRLIAACAEMDIGIGTLALYRKHLGEACPLKVREYLAHGLPVIGAYYDTDVHGQDFFLELPNSETGVRESLPRIRSFVERWRGQRVALETAATMIGAEAKEARRLAFFQEILYAD